MFKPLFATAALALAIGQATAAYPERPIRMVVPFPPGSITDVVARSLGQGMAAELGQPVVVENKPGANGIIGTQDVVKAQPDGYTLVVVGVSTAASGVSLFKNLPYDPARDLTPIGAVAETPYLLVGGQDVAGKTVADLYDYGRQHPGKLTYAYGSGSAQVFGAKLAAMGDITVTPVPYRGGPQALTDVIGGTVDLTFTDLANGLQQARAGKVKVYGVSTPGRFALTPDIPTLNESGAPGFDLTVWFGLMGPAGLPPAVTERLAGALDKALAAPELTQTYTRQGLSVKTQGPAAFGAFVRSEIDKWAGIVKETGIAPQ
ncbi:Bug family tripartite tricarboxylate transporter substrate binding protein [Bordetella bronchiseptica]|uniref:Bug family tripartite tricarboxylate transporter substrate binding protein n=1 Tax=Bordetella bronchiseptica TaxID=518 RepID=UPI000444E73C|nr:tripartite tricarboxylate transporter substrate binding protein [Bordetella bronchiseptica]AWP80091.1 ABC transporter substrate-binding protein [Bordetella bronchiseptica]AWP84893.1 ABC transporter substrate-binding protein [Bordetella bronchiseptica]AWQ10468.1 ABC transporter substrate-binding protein [Bordetella bronchiseptica]AXT89112.1 tripartite tricarboxylate transporter substrate binding protein [Bordetella bronchiseptica]KDB75147.1 tripartite tricarboxylate transporter family recept